MSLKAKLEAVIYAAEEPVTLNQLAALFAADALEWKLAREAAAAEQAAEVAGMAPDGLPFIEVQETREQGTEGTGEGGAIPPADGVILVGEGDGYEAIVLEGEAGQESRAEHAAEAAAAGDAESEAKRMARQRDREVKAVLKQLLDELIASSQADGRGVEVREIAGGYRMATKPECHDAVRLFVKSLKPPLKLSLPALETLAVIAYKQPVTAPEVNEIRGVESAGVLGSLLARKLIATAGRKPVIGRPILYKTTKEFLLRFGLKDVSELPSMEEFEKIAATELEMEPEAAEADKAAAVREGAEPNEEGDLESDSPGVEELATTTEAADSGRVESAEAAAENADEPRSEGEPPTHTGASNEEEATAHAQEIEKEG